MSVTYSLECKIFMWTSWRSRYLSGLFYGCSRLCPILPVWDPLFCCYLHLVVLVIPIWVSRLSQNTIWLAESHLDIFAPFPVGCSSCIFMMFTISGSDGDCYDELFWLPLNSVKSINCHYNVWIINYLWRPIRLVVLVFKGRCDLYGGKLLFSVGCWLCYDCYVWSCRFLIVIVTFWGGGFSLL